MAVVEAGLLRRQAYVDGQWVDADSGEIFPVIDPAKYGIDEWREPKYLAIGL